MCLIKMYKAVEISKCSDSTLNGLWKQNITLTQFGRDRFPNWNSFSLSRNQILKTTKISGMRFSPFRIFIKKNTELSTRKPTTNSPNNKHALWYIKLDFFESVLISVTSIVQQQRKTDYTRDRFYIRHILLSTANTYPFEHAPSYARHHLIRKEIIQKKYTRKHTCIEIPRNNNKWKP